MLTDNIISTVENQKFYNDLCLISQIIASKTVPLVLEYSNSSYTDNVLIHIGVSEFFTKDIYTEADLITYLKGLTIHESAHIKNSNFLDFKEFLERVYEKYSKIDYLREYAAGFTTIGKLINNCIEDGRIELIESLRYFGNIKILKYMRSIWYRENGIYIEEKDDEKRLNDLILAICSMSTLGQEPLNWDLVYSNTIENDILMQVEPLVKKGVICNNHKAVGDICFDILDLMEDYLKNILIPEPFHPNVKAQDENESTKETVKNDLKSSCDTKDIESSSSSSNNEDSPNNNENISPKADSSINSTTEINSEDKDLKSENSESTENTSNDYKRRAKEYVDKLEEDGDLGVTNLAEGEEYEISEEQREFYNDFNINLDSYKKIIEDSISKERFLNEENNKPINSYTENTIKTLQNGKSFVLRKYNLSPSKSPFDNEIYFFKNQIEDILLAKKAKKKKGRKYGSLDCNNCYKVELGIDNVFVKNIKGRESNFCISMLIDSSGSMQGDLMKNAQKTCIILEEVLKDIVPLQIAFFSTIESECIHRIVKDFDTTFQSGSTVNSYAPEAYGVNRDGLHIKYAIDELSKRNERNKFLIVLSDGLPSDYRDNLDGIKDVRDSVEEGYFKGIHTICIAIGPSYHSILNHKPIYDKMYKNLIISEGNDIYSKLSFLVKKLF